MTKKEGKKINIIDIIFPPVCSICDKIGERGLCKKCEKRLENKVIYGIEKIDNRNYDELIYLFKYEGEIRRNILDLKFNEKNYKYEGFVKILENNKKICNKIKKYDIIIPVPISKKRQKSRGYNQSALFAKEISKILSVKYDENILIKVKDNIAQSQLSKEDRIINTKNVYHIKNKEKIVNKKILILDDIYTTGSTVDECSRILKENLAKSIGVLVIAKD